MGSGLKNLKVILLLRHMVKGMDMIGKSRLHTVLYLILMAITGVLELHMVQFHIYHLLRILLVETVE